jgi:hypothetical protein
MKDNRTQLSPLRFDGATPALDGLCDGGVGLFSGHNRRVLGPAL